MNTIILLLFFLTFLVISIINFKKETNIESFVLADRNKSSFLIAASIFASVLGASATVGVVELACKEGLQSIWWLLSGVVGLTICGALLGKKIINQNLYTLTGLVDLYFGIVAKKIVSLLVYIAWCSVVSAQFIAASLLVSSFTNLPYNYTLVFLSIYIVALCLVGGQRVILKSDLVQFFIIIVGLISVSLYLWIFKKDLGEKPIQVDILTGNFKLVSMLYYLVVVGSGFVIGPDIFSRLFSAGSKKAATTSPMIAALFLFIVNIFIVLIGLWARKNHIESSGENSILYQIMNHHLPYPLKLLLALTMLSTILSSANTCIISASTIFATDFLEKKSVIAIRICGAILSLIAILIALLNTSIIKLLLISYSLFNIGVVPPLFVALLIAPKRRQYKAASITAMVIGSACGLASTLMGRPTIALIGFCLSFLISLFSYKNRPSS